MGAAACAGRAKTTMMMRGRRWRRPVGVRRTVHVEPQLLNRQRACQPEGLRHRERLDGPQPTRANTPPARQPAAGGGVDSELLHTRLTVHSEGQHNALGCIVLAESLEHVVRRPAALLQHLRISREQWLEGHDVRVLAWPQRRVGGAAAHLDQEPFDRGRQD